jgi:hypothetical protein
MRDRFNWLLPFYAAVGALFLFVPFITTFGYDGGEFLYVLLAIPIISIVDAGCLLGFLLGLIEECSGSTF